MLPFVYLFNNPIGYYIYDINTNQIIEIEKSFYYLLKKGLEDKSFEFYNCEEYKELISNGYLSSNYPETIENPVNNYISIYLHHYLNSLTLQVTQNCNMRCRYCYFSGNGEFTRQHNNGKMTWDTARKAIDFLAKNSDKSSRIQISFYGGEPLLEYILIKKCVEYARNVFFNKDISFSITSNGTIINEAILSFLISNKIQLVVSLDGPKNINDLNRRYSYNGKGTFETVYKNLEFIKNKAPNYFNSIVINAVVERDSSMKSSEKFFESDELLKNNTVYLNKVSDSYVVDNYATTPSYICSEKTKSLNDILDSLSGKITKTNERNILSLDKIKNSFCKMPPLQKKFHHNGPCIPGYEKMLIDINGNIFPCENASEKSKNSMIGSITHGFYYDKIIKHLNIGAITKDDCKKCICMRHCNICPVNIDNIDDYSLKIKKNLCDSNLQRFKELLNDFTVYKRIGLI